MTGFLVKVGMGLIPAWSCSQNQSGNSLCRWRGVTDRETEGQRGQEIDWKLSISLELDGIKDKTTLLCSFGKKFNWHISMCSGHHPQLSRRANVIDIVTEGWSTHEWMENGQESHRLLQIEKDMILVLFCFWDKGNNTEFLIYHEWGRISCWCW